MLPESQRHRLICASNDLGIIRNRRRLMIRSAVAVWKGSPAIGEGTVSTYSGVLSKALYSFGSSTGIDPCTSPSEMLAASVASCISLIVAQELAKLGIRHDSIKAESSLTLQEKQGHWEILEVDVEVSASVPEAEENSFHKAVKNAKNLCGITRALKVPVKLTSKIEVMETISTS
jgi:osmotically inducible protein OsmC